MPSELLGSNVVIVARQFNPSVFSQLWLVRNGIVKEDEFSSGCLFSEEVAQIETKQFGLLILPPQLQFQPRVSSDSEAELVNEKVGAIVKTLPHTPYTALGLNFLWAVWPDDGNMHNFSKSLFLGPSGPFSGLFGDAEDAMYGAYISKNILNCRLRLDVKPIDMLHNNETQRRLHFAFNFQVEVSQEHPLHTIGEHLSQWKQLKDEATRIVDLVEGYKEDVS